MGALTTIRRVSCWSTALIRYVSRTLYGIAGRTGATSGPLGTACFPLFGSGIAVMRFFAAIAGPVSVGRTAIFYYYIPRTLNFITSYRTYARRCRPLPISVYTRLRFRFCARACIAGRTLASPGLG